VIIEKEELALVIVHEHVSSDVKTWNTATIVIAM
jgi:hypothetical protein